MRTLADGTFLTGKRLVPELLDECPVNMIQAFSESAGATWMPTGMTSFSLQPFSQISSPCSKGLNARQAEFAVRKYRSHQRIGALVMMSLSIFDNPV